MEICVKNIPIYGFATPDFLVLESKCSIVSKLSVSVVPLVITCYFVTIHHRLTVLVY